MNAAPQNERNRGTILTMNATFYVDFKLFAACVLFTTTALSAQPLAMSANPADIAQVALGRERGTVAVGSLTSGQPRYAHLQQTGDTGATMATTPLPSLAPQPLFEIGSVTKVFTGLLLAQAVEKGDLSLDDHLARLLPGKTIDSPAVAAITLRQLVTHTSCLPRAPAGVDERMSQGNPYGVFSRTDMWQTLATLKLDAAAMPKPPCPAAYSNFGMGLLGELLSERYGKPWQVLVRDNITGPLGMKETVQHLQADGVDLAPRMAQGFNNRALVPPWGFAALAGAGALRSTAADMLVFSQALMAGRSGPLGKAAERMLTPLGDFRGSPIGYALFMRGPPERRIYWHDGLTGGYRTLWMIAPASNESVIVLASNSHAPTGLAQVFITAHHYPPQAKANPSARVKLEDYQGVYKLDETRSVAFMVQNGQLLRRITGGGYRPVVPAGQDTFIDADYGVQYDFVRENGVGTGAMNGEFKRDVKSLVFTQGGGGFTAVKTDGKLPELGDLSAEKMKDYLGRFRRERIARLPLDFEITAEGQQLWARSTNWPRYPVFPVKGEPDRFYYEAINAALEFERDASGKVVGLALFEGGVNRMVRVSD